MIKVDATIYRKRPTDISIYKRLMPPLRASTQGTARQSEADVVASGFDARKGGVKPPPSVMGEDGAASPDVDIADVNGLLSLGFNLIKSIPTTQHVR